MKLVFAAVMALSLTACDYTEVTRETGYKGKARINPWLAAERFTERMGYEVRSVGNWTSPDWEDAVWVVPAVVLGNESYIRDAEEWTRGGGHLILLIENADAETNDWGGHSAKPELPPAFLSLMERVHLRVEASTAAKSGEIEFEGEVYEVDAKSNCSVAEEDGENGVFASAETGDGRVSVLTDARIFRNRWIDAHDHAVFLDALLGSTEYDGAVVYMRGSGSSFWELVRRHLWPVLLGLGVWLLLWLWKNLTRFGPLEAAGTPSELRGYEHHLAALGSFQWRLDRAASLLAPLRTQIVELGQRESAGAGRRDADLFQFLSERAGIPRDRVFRALAETAPADPSILTRTTADLQQLLKVLQHSSPS